MVLGRVTVMNVAQEPAFTRSRGWIAVEISGYPNRIVKYLLNGRGSK
jgi:hypothetical protein